MNKSREVTFKMNFPEGIVWKSKWFRRMEFVWSLKVMGALYTEGNFTRDRSPDYPSLIKNTTLTCFDFLRHVIMMSFKTKSGLSIFWIPFSIEFRSCFRRESWKYYDIYCTRVLGAFLRYYWVQGDMHDNF